MMEEGGGGGGGVYYDLKDCFNVQDMISGLNRAPEN